MNQLKLVVSVAALALAFPARAEPNAPPAPVLGLQDALALVTTDQPRIEAHERDAEASQQAAVAARSLPDPQLTAGIQNFPITGRNAFSPTKDMMTMLSIGVMREQVRRSKREAEAQKILAEALVSNTQASAEERHIRRNVMLAWIDAVGARAKQHLLQQIIADLRTGRKVMAAAIPTGGSTPALALQADGEIAIEESELADADRAEKLLRDAVRALKGIGDRGYLCEAQRALAMVLVEQDALDEAERFALEARETVGPEDRVSVSSTKLALGLVRAAQRRDEEAEELMVEAVEGFSLYELRALEHWALRHLAEFLHSRGRDEEALVYEARRAELAPSSTVSMV